MSISLDRPGPEPVAGPTSVTLLYTANLRGDLQLLPALFALIQQERRSATGLTFLLDLGDTCVTEAWICQATQGRAPLIVLESMGYDAAIIGGAERVPIPPVALRQLISDGLSMAVIPWGRTRPLSKRGVEVTVCAGLEPQPGSAAPILIHRGAQTLPGLGTSPPSLGDVPHGHLARVDLAWPACTVQQAALLAPPPSLAPDPTIAAVVELVESEARRYAQQQGETP